MLRALAPAAASALLRAIARLLPGDYRGYALPWVLAAVRDDVALDAPTRAALATGARAVARAPGGDAKAAAAAAAGLREILRG